MFRFLPFLSVRGEPFDAPDLATAQAIADRIYGVRLVRVQSEVSAQLGDEDREALARNHRIGWPTWRDEE